jgi:5-methyltetrahydropteroyltriglutamate--homocysteine methyltransferase
MSVDHAGEVASRSVARAETVGSLLRPPDLLRARRDLGEAAVRELEDAAVLDAIELQESAGLDVITDGEMRRHGWVATTEALDFFELREGGPGLTWHGAPELGDRPVPYPTNQYPTVVRPIELRKDLAVEYAFLAARAHTRTKYSFPAPSYHRRFWYEQHSTAAYPSCEDFLCAVRDYQRELVGRLAALGCDYVQLDAPNYGTLCDRDNRRMMEERGHHLDAELAFDAEVDSSVFEGVSGITRAMHVCRGNAAGRWHSSGGYEVIAEQLFPRLDLDVLLLEYDTERAGGFEPLRQVRPGTVAVLGLLTTKSGALESESEVERRITEAARIKPLEELALSPQCGFASLEAGNPISPSEQRAKLELVANVARRVWG